MAPSSNSAGTNHPPHLATAACSLLILSFAATGAAATSVYRCISPTGDLEFRQTPCAGGTEEQEVRVEDRKTGWEPARTEIERKPKRPPGTTPRKPKPEQENRPALARQEEKCWHRRRQLEEINRKLRRGYKPATGVKLRRQRQVHEDYIRRFCK